MEEPWFWRDKSHAARLAGILFTPLGAFYDIGQRLRKAVTKPLRGPVPIICIGNATLGGVGKTPFAMALASMLQDDFSLAFLSRGYDGALKGPVRVDPDKHSAGNVGDEPLMLASRAPAYIARKRIDGARLAANDGAKLIIMDDGFQNPTIAKDFSVLLLAADDMDGNGRIFPAGPLREPLARAAARADAIVLIGEAPDDETVASFEKPIFHARLTVAEDAPSSGDAIAFCGIARPQRFFRTLKENGWKLKDEVSFPDHHAFTPAEIVSLKRRAKESGAALITTEKDFVRLALADREGVSFLPVAMQIDTADRLKALIIEKLSMREATA